MDCKNGCVIHIAQCSFENIRFFCWTFFGIHDFFQFFSNAVLQFSSCFFGVSDNQNFLEGASFFYKSSYNLLNGIRFSCSCRSLHKPVLFKVNFFNKTHFSPSLPTIEKFISPFCCSTATFHSLLKFMFGENPKSFRLSKTFAFSKYDHAFETILV
ncbi:MAG: hypothetical protein BWZ11_01800 [Bacteroidetes bacterium ADurb.BinA395]|nr:MAG: hypothetical protein BWZ11_01800 [Bacteroidetes bacterium ADurb.BinA395]